jgi:hypothetical protein
VLVLSGFVRSDATLTADFAAAADGELARILDGIAELVSHAEL